MESRLGLQSNSCCSSAGTTGTTSHGSHRRCHISLMLSLCIQGSRGSHFSNIRRWGNKLPLPCKEAPQARLSRRGVPFAAPLTFRAAVPKLCRRPFLHPERINGRKRWRLLQADGLAKVEEANIPLPGTSPRTGLLTRVILIRASYEYRVIRSGWGHFDALATSRPNGPACDAQGSSRSPLTKKGCISLYSRIFTVASLGPPSCSIAKKACSDCATIARARSFLWIE